MELKEVFKKIQMGDYSGIDKELQFFVDEVSPLVDKLDQLGSEYRLTARNLKGFVNQSLTYLKNRKELR